MIMRSLMRTGVKITAVTYVLGWAFQFAGVTWPEDALSVLFLLGIADVLIAAAFNLAASLRAEGPPRGRRLPAGRAGDYLPHYPAGLSSWTPVSRIPPVGLPPVGWRPPLGMPPGAQKRLLPERYEGVEFPEPPVYSTSDRRGEPIPTFPVHYRTVPAGHELVDGVRMAPAVLEHHADAEDHPDCPECEAWRTERRW